MVEVTEGDKVLADAVAEAIASVSVAYSHDTNSELRTINRQWFVHDTCEGNPFDKKEWLAVFDNKAEANECAGNLRKERAYTAAATHRIEAAKAERDRLRELAAGPAAWLGRWAKHVGDCQGGCVCSCGLTLAQMEAEQLIAALESQP